METKIRLKIKELVDESGQTAHSLSDNPAQNRRLNRQINEGYALTIPTLLDILDKFPTVSSEWLLRGEGEKYKTDVPQENDTDEVADLRAELTRVHAERDEYKQIIEDLKRQAKEWRESDEYKRELEELKRKAKEWQESDEYKRTLAELRAEAADLRARLDEQRNTTRILAEAMGKHPQQTTATKVTPRFVQTNVGGKQVEVPVFTLGEATPSGIVANAKAKKNIG